jgi:hypothetical protein
VCEHALARGTIRLARFARESNALACHERAYRQGSEVGPLDSRVNTRSLGAPFASLALLASRMVEARDLHFKCEPFPQW